MHDAIAILVGKQVAIIITYQIKKVAIIIMNN
jgi:hypothetical protein